METRIIKIHPDTPDRSTLKAVAKMLLQDRVAVLPTDTIYGLHCRTENRETVRAVQALKGRAEPKPMVMLVPSRFYLESAGFVIPPKAQALMDKFWPGPLTLVLPAPPGLPDWLKKSETGTVAIRLPGYPILNKILEFAGVPLLSTSANPTGEEPLQDINAIIAAFEGKVDAVLDAGNLPVRKPSTIVSFAESHPRIEREGIIPADFILPLI